MSREYGNHLELGYQYLREAKKWFACHQKKKGCYWLKKANIQLALAFKQHCSCDFDDRCDRCPGRYDYDDKPHKPYRKPYHKPYKKPYHMPYDNDGYDQGPYDHGGYDRNGYGQW